IVLITLDTLRRDYLSCYGYPHPTTPFLDRLAAGGVRFANAYSPSSWTVPSLVSLLSSLDPTTHGVNYGYTTDEQGVILDQRPLGGELVLLPELLRRAGYRTLGVVASEHLQASLGFARGFDAYRCLGFVSGDRLQPALRQLAAGVDRSRPFFLWVHYFDPHAPYDSDRPELRDYLGGRERDPALLRRLQSFSAPEPFAALDLEHEPDALPYVRASYASDVRQADDWVAALFATFQLGADDLIVVASDHGEELHEHGGFWHGHSLYDELLRVPLIVRLPAGRLAGRTVDTRVSLLDVLPTILAAAGLEPAPSAQGRDLLPLAEGRRAEDAAIHATTGKIEEIEALLVGRFKYVRYLGSGRTLLFDLVDDPGERHDLSRSRSAELAALHRELAELRMRRRPRIELQAASPMPPERIEALRSLGYLH
ncbi:MAG TPA: sulfatase, partial [Candidatus Polarisedimenticolaceae bacterium]|nr:sulfatase [Candidatus Polarisedimenticolaceae bacterium]